MTTPKEKLSQRIAVRLAKSVKNDEAKAWQVLNAFWSGMSPRDKQIMAKAFQKENHAELGRFLISGARRQAVLSAKTRADELLADNSLSLAELEEAFL